MSAIFVICVAVLAIQIIYFTVFLIAFSRDKRNPSTNLTTSVSVIVCAHDEEENLRQLLPILLSQDHNNFEVIIVNDRSNDGTYDYLLKETAANPKLRMVTVRDTPKHMSGKKFALTMGIKAAKNDWVLLTDADCRPGPHWVSEMLQHASDDKSIIISISPYEKHPGLLNSFIRFEAFVTVIQYIGFALSGRPYMGVGRNLAYRRKLFIESKGFNNHLDVLGGDDDLFVNEHATPANVAVAIGSSVVVRSVPKKTWSEFFHQKLRHLSVGTRYRFSDRLFLGLFSITWILSPFTWAALPFLGTYWSIVGGLILLRIILLCVLFNAAPRRLGEPFETWKTPFLDFIYGFYYLVAGPISFFTKRGRWKI
ncbi:MAG TPA: glycosyltransferase [Cyclobacteriaceae bacterium]|nr:glycosyltransferase [Cyclobacteriaceae bacterium]